MQPILLCSLPPTAPHHLRHFSIISDQERLLDGGAIPQGSWWRASPPWTILSLSFPPLFFCNFEGAGGGWCVSSSWLFCCFFLMQRGNDPIHPSTPLKKKKKTNKQKNLHYLTYVCSQVPLERSPEISCM